MPEENQGPVPTSQTAADRKSRIKALAAKVAESELLMDKYLTRLSRSFNALQQTRRRVKRWKQQISQLRQFEQIFSRARGGKRKGEEG